MSRLRLFIPVAVFVVMAGLFSAALREEGRDPNQVPSALIDRPLPAFSLPGLLDGERSYATADLVGTVTLLNVWGTWCPPCHVEHPYLVEISKREPGVVFVGVNYKDSVREAREFLSERGNPFTYNIVDAEGTLGLDLGVTGAPESFLIDSSGTIRYKHIGVIDNKVWGEVFKPLIVEITK